MPDGPNARAGTQVLGSEEAGEAFVEILAHWHGNALNADHKAPCWEDVQRYCGRDTRPSSAKRPWFWRWLDARIQGSVERHTFSFFWVRAAGAARGQFGDRQLPLTSNKTSGKPPVVSKLASAFAMESRNTPSSQPVSSSWSMSAV